MSATTTETSPKTKAHIELLTKFIGHHCRLVNWASEETWPDKVAIHVHGKLEFEEEYGSYYIRIGEDPAGHGSNGITFYPANVAEVFKQPSGIIAIILNS
jgi:hypothetical protein